MDICGEAEGTNGQRLMVRVADKRGQRILPRLTAAGWLKLPSGYALVLTEVAWPTHALGPPGMVAGQAASQAARRLRASGLGLTGTAALLLGTRPADDSGRPVGRNTRYVSAGTVDAGSWLKGRGQGFGRRYAHPASRAA
eukprot:4917145-Alexandrium_andersonii.AAC.1